MLSKIKSFKFLVLIFIFSNLLAKEVDDNDEEQLFEGIIKAIKELRIPYSSYEDTIDQKTYIKLLKHLMLSEIDSMGIMDNVIEDSFLLKLSREVTENLPKEIKIKDLHKYLNPRIIEPIINKILQEIDLNSLLKKVGDTFGFEKIFNEQMKERDRKDKEREKINQERIKRKELREQQKQMKQNSTKDINDTKENDKKKDENKDINNDL
jgi:hypothetical protein